ncbi:MAG TPA: hypothetical protein VMV10_03260 [Pirellulales bacterium]|nr:hypothetical protein [Pirellulales bacterium]
MNRYLLPLAFVALFFFAGHSAFAHDHDGGCGGWGHHHGYYGGFNPGFGRGYGLGYGGMGYGGQGYGGLGYGMNYGFANPAYGFGYTGFAAPNAFGNSQNYFASPAYGQWGGFGPGF